MKPMKRALKVTDKLEKQHRGLIPEESIDLMVVPVEPYPAYPSPMRVVQSVTTYSACEEPIPNPYKRS